MASRWQRRIDYDFVLSNPASIAFVVHLASRETLPSEEDSAEVPLITDQYLALSPKQQDAERAFLTVTDISCSEVLKRAESLT